MVLNLLLKLLVNLFVLFECFDCSKLLFYTFIHYIANFKDVRCNCCVGGEICCVCFKGTEKRCCQSALVIHMRESAFVLCFSCFPLWFEVGRA